MPPVTHTHALFAEQSQSILDILMEIIGPELSIQWLSRGYQRLKDHGAVFDHRGLRVQPYDLLAVRLTAGDTVAAAPDLDVGDQN